MNRIFRFFLITSVIGSTSLLSTGPAAAIDVCGNGICATNAIPPETPANCPADCGPGPGPTCVDDICGNGSCSQPSAGTDLDFDGVSDLLEHQLAHKFFPAALLQWADVDRDESYLFRNRSTPYVVLPYTAGNELCDNFLECLEIRWGLVYFRDHGDTLDSGHLGDSEMYAALLRRNPFWPGPDTDPQAWEMIRDFTAAHWGASSDSSRVGSYSHCPEPCSDAKTSQACNARPACMTGGQCSGASYCASATTEGDCTSRRCTWTPSCQERYRRTCYSNFPQDDPVTLFVSESKHGTYHTDDECDNGAFWGSDDCPNNAFDLSTAKSGRLQNVGNPGAHATFDTTIQDPSHCGLYDVWSGAPFGEATSYRQNFTTWLNWQFD